MTLTGPPRTAGVHPLLEQAFASLDAEQVRWCLLRGEDELDGSATDVDLLVAGDDLERAGRLFAALGFERLRAWGHGSHAFFLAYHEETDRWLWLDVVTDVRFGRYQSVCLGVEADLLARRERRAGLPVLAPSDAFWMLLLHCLLDKDMIRVERRARLAELSSEAEDDVPLSAVVAPWLPVGRTPKQLVEAVEAGRWAELEALGRSLRRELTDRVAGSAGPRVVWNRLLRAATRVGRLVSLRGVTVALLGPDGSGKTTLAAALQSSFPSRRVRVVYMGLYRRPPRRALPGLYLASRLALAWARFLRVELHRVAGRVVVLDRHVHDVLLPAHRPLRRLEHAHRWLVGHSLPEPDLVLVLDVPGATAFARKPEEDAASLERQRAAYRELSGRLRNAYVVDASQDAEAVRRRAVSLVWRACSGRRDRR
jgi:thymidylate kinase